MTAPHLERDGFSLLSDIFTPQDVEAALAGLSAAMTTASGSVIRGGTGIAYAARNVAELWPCAADVWRRPALLRILAAVLGERCGLVRVLFFDKPPGQTWALPWHKDVTVAVRDNTLPSRHFTKPTRKAGVSHAEAPLELLQQMLTVRWHLDEVTEENGPLRVVPGSHHTGTELELGAVAPVTVLARRGDVLLMRPLLAHCSNRSAEGTARHRRILHFEFAAVPELPDGYAWHRFEPAFPTAEGTPQAAPVGEQVRLCGGIAGGGTPKLATQLSAQR